MPTVTLDIEGITDNSVDARKSR